MDCATNDYFQPNAINQIDYRLCTKGYRMHCVNMYVSLYDCVSLQSVPRGYDSCAFYLWFNTSFIENNRWAFCIQAYEHAT